MVITKKEFNLFLFRVQLSFGHKLCDNENMLSIFILVFMPFSILLRFNVHFSMSTRVNRYFLVIKYRESPIL